MLLNKLWKIGVRGKLWLLLRSYLSNRKHLVSINGWSSTLLNVTSGALQGSTLGPLIFLIYAVDLTHNFRTVPFMFTDDSKIITTLGRPEDSSLLDDLSTLNNWSLSNKLPFNLDKCHILTFSPSSTADVIDYKLGNHRFARVRSENDLGVTIEHSL